MSIMVSLIPGLAPQARKLARLGTWGLAFFVAKGLLWLIIPLLAMRFT